MHQVGEKQEKYNREILEARSRGYELVEKEKASRDKDVKAA